MKFIHTKAIMALFMLGMIGVFLTLTGCKYKTNVERYTHFTLQVLKVENKGVVTTVWEGGDADTVVIPATINGTTIEGGTGAGADLGAFQDKTNFKHVYIPAGVTSIGNYAFWNCNSLGSIELPDEVTSIGIEALKKLYISG